MSSDKLLAETFRAALQGKAPEGIIGHHEAALGRVGDCKVDPVVYCDLYNGLFTGSPGNVRFKRHSDGKIVVDGIINDGFAINDNVLQALKALREANRKIIIVHSLSFKPPARTDLPTNHERAFPFLEQAGLIKDGICREGVELRDPLQANSEFNVRAVSSRKKPEQRAVSDIGKAELVISSRVGIEILEAKEGSVTVLRPSQLAL
jgi:hypothetical protein